MKADELMLGDWVMDTEFDHNVPRRVEIIETRRVWLEGLTCYQPLSTIEPIPLTPEILEKNGWDEWYMYFHLPIDQQQHMRYYRHDGSMRRYYEHKNGNMEQVFEVRAINHVHKLQHALRLCGIEKDIEI